MDLPTELRADHSKAQAERIARAVLTEPHLLDELWAAMAGNDPLLSQRASWPIGKIAEQRPELLYPYTVSAYELLSQPRHDAVHRAVGKALSEMPQLPEKIEGPLYDLCLRLLSNPQVKVGIQVHCMSVAFRIAQVAPELQAELAGVLEEGIRHGSAGYRSRGGKLLARLKQQLA